MSLDDDLRRAAQELRADKTREAAAHEASLRPLRERDAARAAYEATEQAAAMYVVHLLDRVVHLLEGTSTALVELRPESIPRPQPKSRGWFRRQDPDPVLDEAVIAVEGWTLGDGAAARVLTRDRRMFRFGDWSVQSQSQSVEDWALGAVRRAARIHHIYTTPDEGSTDVHAITQDRFAVAFGIPMHTDAIEQMEQLVERWKSDQQRACAALLASHGAAI